MKIVKGHSLFTQVKRKLCNLQFRNPRKFSPAKTFRLYSIQQSEGFTPCVVVGPHENVVHDDTTLLAGVPTKLSQQWQQLCKLVLAQSWQHSLAEVEGGQLRRLIPAQSKRR